MMVEFRMNTRSGLLNRPTESGGARPRRWRVDTAFVVGPSGGALTVCRSGGTRGDKSDSNHGQSTCLNMCGKYGSLSPRGLHDWGEEEVANECFVMRFRHNSQ
jgi:hypothetical protein